MIAAIAIGTIFAALGLFALVKLRRVPDRHVLPLWWSRPIVGPALVQSVRAIDAGSPAIVRVERDPRVVSGGRLRKRAKGGER